MENRDAFLNRLAQRLGREPRQTPEPMPVVEVENNPAINRLAGQTPQQSCDNFIAYATQVMQAHCELTPLAEVAQATERLCQHYGGSPVLISGDTRLKDIGVTEHLQHAFKTQLWTPNASDENLRIASKANMGVVYAEYGLSETGGVVLFSTPEQGRAISLLPTSTVFILRKSRLLPSVAQLAQVLRQMAQAGDPLPSCINLIAGPSSTADIELTKVVGVHGPLNAVYLIIEDC